MQTVDEMLEQDIPAGMGAMTAGPPLVIDVRQWNKKGLLRDEGAAFKLVWESGAGLAVIALREAVKLRYELAGEQATQEISLSWTDGRPSFLCPCGKQATKLYFAGQRFVCRRCHLGILLPPRPKRRVRRIPAAARLKALVTSGFRCPGCGTAEGGLVVRNICPRCDYEGMNWSHFLYVECRACYKLSRRGYWGLLALADRLRELGRWHTDPQKIRAQVDKTLREADATRRLKSSFPTMTPDYVFGGVSNGKTATSAEKNERKRRRRERREKRHRIEMMLMLGCRTNDIVAFEGVSRQTVWRCGKRPKNSDPLLALVRRMMRQAARRQDWDEARLWWECLRRVGADMHADDTATSATAKKLRPVLEAVRDDALGRKKVRQAAA